MEQKTVGIMAAIAAAIFTVVTVVEMVAILSWNYMSITITMPMLIIMSASLGLVSMFIAITMFYLSGERGYAFRGMEARASERVADLEELMR